MENNMDIYHNVASTTSVADKDLPPVLAPKFVNAPDTVEDAIKRIMELEMRLEDLSRAAEIAQITRQFEMLDSFKMAADDCLKTKIEIKQPSAEDFKITIVSDKEDVKA
jgi:hypothetical protein